VRKVLRSGWLTSGAVCRQFEQEFAAYVHSGYAVAVNSCTAALHLSLLAAGIKPGDEVITTPYTFVASAETIIHCGARPRFIDTEADSFNIDLEKAADSINGRTRAILPVHVAGLPCDLQRLDRIRREAQIAVVQDAAHALGAGDRGAPVGSTRDFSCFSFYATKNLTTGEGGMVTTNSRRHAEKVRLLSLHGMSRGAWNRYQTGGHWRYQITDLGYKYNLSDVNAALGLAQLRRFGKLQLARRRVVGWYRQRLADIDALELPSEPDGVTHAWHLYIVKLRDRSECRRNRLIEQLKKAGVGTSVHFIPLNLQPYYRKRYALSAGDFPHATAHYRSAITLPLYPDLRRAEVDYIADTLRKLLR
jgi:dTDP-4-amino-4,6-dideoxygalactose transaminase